MVFTGIRVGTSGRVVVVLKVVPADSVECQLLERSLVDFIDMCMVPIIAMLPVFTRYRGCPVRAACMPLLTRVGGSFKNKTMPLAAATLAAATSAGADVVGDIARQMLGVSDVAERRLAPNEKLESARASEATCVFGVG